MAQQFHEKTPGSLGWVFNPLDFSCHFGDAPHFLSPSQYSRYPGFKVWLERYNKYTLEMDTKHILQHVGLVMNPMAESVNKKQLNKSKFGGELCRAVCCLLRLEMDTNDNSDWTMAVCIWNFRLPWDRSRRRDFHHRRLGKQMVSLNTACLLKPTFLKVDTLRGQSFFLAKAKNLEIGLKMIHFPSQKWMPHSSSDKKILQKT